MFAFSVRILTFLFIIYICSCTEENVNDNEEDITNNDETLKPLQMPEQLNEKYQTSIMNHIFNKWGVNPSTDQTPSSPTKLHTLWKALPSTSVLTFNYWLKTDPFANACETEKVGTELLVTERGENLCSEKCWKQNQEYAKYLEKPFQEIVSKLSKTRSSIKAIIAPVNHDSIHECVSKLVFRGMKCECKQNLQILVNAEFQALFNKAFGTSDPSARGSDGNDDGLVISLLKIFGIYYLFKTGHWLIGSILTFDWIA